MTTFLSQQYSAGQEAERNLSKLDDAGEDFDARQISYTASVLGIFRGQLQKILKKEGEIRNEAAAGHSSLIRHRNGKDKQVEDALQDWFLFVTSWNTPVNGSILCQKAEQLAKESGCLEFKATDEWFIR